MTKKGLTIAVLVVATNFAIAQPVISVLPETPYVTTEGNIQYLDFDFIVTGQNDGKYDLKQIDLTVFDSKGKVFERRKLNNDGMVSNFAIFPKTQIKKDKSISLFNPFYFYEKEADLNRMVYTFTFTKGKEDITITKEISPSPFNQKTELRVPLKGRVIVDSGFDHHAHHRRLNTTHWGMKLLKVSKNITRYAIDFAPCDEDGIIHTGDGKRIDDYMGFGKPVLAPASGQVVEVVDSLPDNEIDGKLPFGLFKLLKNPKLASGNYMVIDHQNGEVSLLAHMKAGSILFKKGQKVKAGEQVGQLGNSGDSTFPHLHYQLENEHTLNVETYPARFSGISWMNGDKQDGPVYCNTGDLLMVD